MTKTYEIQVNLAKAMVKEARNRITEMQNRGCSVNIPQMESIIQKADKIQASDEKKIEMRSELSNYTAKLNDEFIDFKSDVSEFKRMIKSHFHPAQWKEFGIQDKQ